MNKQFPVLAARLTLLFGMLGWSVSAIGQGAGGSNDAMLLLLEQKEATALDESTERQGRLRGLRRRGGQDRRQARTVRLHQDQ